MAFFARERFGSIAAAVADGEAYWRSEAQRQRESTVAAAEAAQADAHAKLQDAVTRLERRVAGDGVSGNIPQALREALEAKRRQLAATPARSTPRRGRRRRRRPRPTSRCAASSPR